MFSTGRVSNVTLRYVLKFRTLASCLSTSGDQACCIAVTICLINPLEGLLVRSYYCIYTSCVSFVNAFRQCKVITTHCVRSCAFLLSHARPYGCRRRQTLYCRTIDVKNIDFRIKNIKNMFFFTFIKTF